jgi:ABC-type branched-subunit amino acid transport system ATPase component
MLEVSNINVFYGQTQVLWDLSLFVAEGEIAAIVARAV